MNSGLRHFGNNVIQISKSRIWRDFGSALPFQTRLTQTKPVLPLSNEHSSQVKDQGRQQCCHNKHKNFPNGLHVMYRYFPETPHTITIYAESVRFTDILYPYFWNFYTKENTRNTFKRLIDVENGI
jgi:hypothetical protein